MRQTSFSDVCGTIAELKRRLAEDPAAGIRQLLDDALFMIDRMQLRLAEYVEFRDRIAQALAGLDAAVAADTRRVHTAAEVLRTRVGVPGVRRGEMDTAAETIRAAAGDLENQLRACKEAALQINDAFRQIRGTRAWLVDTDESASWADEVARTYQAWLPPAPHREKLLAYLAAAQAHVLDKLLPGGQPNVQFEDGGVIPMCQVRWDPSIENFRAASDYPGPPAENPSVRVDGRTGQSDISQ